jgi:hypothetical protein
MKLLMEEIARLRASDRDLAESSARVRGRAGDRRRELDRSAEPIARLIAGGDNSCRGAARDRRRW